jgi:hypothetical protein
MREQNRRLENQGVCPNYSTTYNRSDCFGSAKFGQMRAFLKLQIICDNLKLGEMHDNQSKVENFA